MIIELIIALIVGILVGTFTGLTPGIHINLVSVILLSFSASLLTITSPLVLSVFIVSMAITHTIIDFIPSIFLGAPNEDTFLSVLPGHKLLLDGKGYLAVIYTLYGVLIALFIVLIFTPIFIYVLPIIYPYFQKIMWLLLITLSAYLIYTEEKDKRLWALIIFLLAGFLGISSLNTNIKEPLLPLLTGLFGASGLLISIKQKTKIPEQKIFPIKEISITKKSIIKISLASIAASPFTAFLPGLGASQASIIGKQLVDTKDPRQFLVLLGGINVIVMGLSFVAFYSIEKTRTGAAVAVSRLLPKMSLSDLVIITGVIIIAGIFSFIIAINLSKFFAERIHKINYSKLSLIILILLLIMVIIFSDFFTISGAITGIIIFLTSASLGIFTVIKKVKRIHLMGCLLIPTILFYLI